MSRDEFEYFFEPEDLDPHYSRLMNLPTPKRRPSKRVANRGKAKPKRRVQQQPPSAAPRAVESNIGTEPVHGSPPNVPATPENSPAVEATENVERNWQESPALAGSETQSIVSVHALGQYLYCKRSAILAAELGDQSNEEELPRLTYLPNFDRERIEEALSKALRKFGLAFLISIVLIALAVVAIRNGSRLLFLCSVFTNVLSSSWALVLLPQITVLAYRRRLAIKTEAQEPLPEVTEIQAVNWWAMLNARYELVSYQDRFVHQEFGLEGRPWRVLERGSQRIPVIRSGSKELGFNEGELYPKHQIRLAAYALLLEAQGGVVAPFGLVFPANSPVGLALPITDELKERTITTLNEFSKVVTQSQKQQVEPRPPENRNLCTECSYGMPEPIQQKEIAAARKVGNPLVVLQSGSGRTYHCPCANRFGSPPPHAKSVKLGLTTTVQ